MSQHEIEGLIEDSVRLVAAQDLPAEQTRVHYSALYAYQSRHDCGYTHFRVKDILMAAGFLFERPIAEHPEFSHPKVQSQLKALETDGSLWFNSPSSSFETVYVQSSDNGDLSFFYDYGDALWEKLDGGGDVPETPNEFTLTRDMMKMAVESGDKTLAMNWYAYLCNVIKELELSAETDAVWKNADFDMRLEHAHLKELRPLAESCEPKKYKEEWGYLALPKWRDEKYCVDQSNPHEMSSVRYLLDFRITLEKLKVAHAKSVKNTAKLAGMLKALPEQLNAAYFADDDWAYAGETVLKEDQSWVWYKDINGTEDAFGDDYIRAFIFVRHEARDGGLSCYLGVQSGLILRWQNSKPTLSVEDAHFTKWLIILPSSKETAESPHLDNLFLWKFVPSSSAATVQKRLNNMVEMIETHADKYFRKVATRYSANNLGIKLAPASSEDWLQAFAAYKKRLIKKQELRDYAISAYYYLPFAFHARDKGDKAGFEAILKATLETVAEYEEDHRSTKYLKSHLQKLLSGETHSFPDYPS